MELTIAPLVFVNVNLDMQGMVAIKSLNVVPLVTLSAKIMELAITPLVSVYVLPDSFTMIALAKLVLRRVTHQTLFFKISAIAMVLASVSLDTMDLDVITNIAQILVSMEDLVT